MIILRLVLMGVLLFVGPVASATDLKDLKPAQKAEYGFLEGSYFLVGKKEGSAEAYSGSLILREEDGVLAVERHIVGQSPVTGTGEVRPLLENSRLLILTYPQGTVPQTVHYLMFSDPDNYPVLAGYAVNEQGRAADISPGLETLFYNHAASHSP